MTASTAAPTASSLELLRSRNAVRARRGWRSMTRHHSPSGYHPDDARKASLAQSAPGIYSHNATVHARARFQLDEAKDLATQRRLENFDARRLRMLYEQWRIEAWRAAGEVEQLGERCNCDDCIDCYTQAEYAELRALVTAAEARLEQLAALHDTGTADEAQTTDTTDTAADTAGSWDDPPPPDLDCMNRRAALLDAPGAPNVRPDGLAARARH